MKVDLVCTKCQESRYRTITDVDASTKVVPEILEALGEQPEAATFKERPTCYQCGGLLRPMPMAERAKPARDAVVAGYEEGTGKVKQTTIFQCAPDESGMEATTLDNGRVLIQTNKRLVLLDLKEL